MSGMKIITVRIFRQIKYPAHPVHSLLPLVKNWQMYLFTGHTNSLFARKPGMVVILYPIVFLKVLMCLILVRFCVKFGHWYLLSWTVGMHVLYIVFWYSLLCHFNHCGCISNKYLYLYMSIYLSVLLLGLYRMGEITVQPNKNNCIYYLAKYE